MRKSLLAIWFLFVLVLAGGYELRDTVTHAGAQSTNGAQYNYINTATTTVVRNGVGYLNAVTINGGTTGAVSIYDVVSSGCTGTPSTGKLAVIQAATAPVTLPYQITIKNGICVVTAAATDVTVSFN